MQLQATRCPRGVLDVNQFLEQEENTSVCEGLIGSGFLVYGTRSSGKSSFAMQFAVNAALRNERVVVLCNEHILMQKVPKPFTPLDGLAPETLSHIEFVNVNSASDVFHQLALISQEEDTPSAILVDDGGLGDVEESGGTLVLAVLSALMNTSEWLSREQPNGNVSPVASCVFVYTTNSLSDYSDTNRIGSRISKIFPVVSLRFAGSGSVVVTVEPTPVDDGVELSSIQLRWTQHGIALR